MLKKRVITALWGMPLLVVVVWFNEPITWFTVFTAIWGLLAALEFYRLTAISGILPLTLFGLVWTALFVTRPHIDNNIYYLLLWVTLLVLPLIILLLFPKRKAIFTTWTLVIGGVLYVGLLLSYLVDLRLEAGRNWVFLVLFATFGSDTMAYFIGKAFGRHHMAPRISPGKTWEGAAAGLIGAVAVSLLFTIDWTLQLPLNYGEAVLLGTLISIFGQLGDLVESMFKRYAGVKESGSLMPGHGGLLDRMDSILFAGVTVHVYYFFFIA
jgi:phosphatidate cytidylyltransferase